MHEICDNRDIPRECPDFFCVKWHTNPTIPTVYPTKEIQNKAYAVKIASES